MNHDSLPTLGLALILGMRHGMAPDHLAAIDGLTMRAMAGGTQRASWMGAAFAAGHNMVLLAVVTLAGLLATRFSLDGFVLDWMNWLDWLPPLLLLGLAARNAQALLRPAQTPVPRAAMPAGATVMMSGTRSALGVGMLFALNADTVLQGMAWGYSAGAVGGRPAALGVAAVFALGMTATDAVDGYLTAHLARVTGAAAMQAFRRRLGWPIVALCACAGLQLLLAKVFASYSLSDGWLMLTGAAMMLATIAAYLMAIVRTYTMARAEPPSTSTSIEK